jgi:hypothetical protein
MRLRSASVDLADAGRMALDGTVLSVHPGSQTDRRLGAKGWCWHDTPFIWIAVALMLIGAVMLVAGIGAPALWIAVITVGIALVAIDRIRARRSLSS